MVEAQLHATEKGAIISISMQIMHAIAQIVCVIVLIYLLTHLPALILAIVLLPISERLPTRVV